MNVLLQRDVLLMVVMGIVMRMSGVARRFVGQNCVVTMDVVGRVESVLKDWHVGWDCVLSRLMCAENVGKLPSVLTG